MSISYLVFLLLELLLLVIAIGLAFAIPRFASSWLESVERAGSAFAQKRGASILLCAAFPVIARLFLLPFLQVPVPAIQEEFSYLLSADTFAHGRLANPPHPMAVHLESFQVLQHPTYSSIRPPAQGLFLALGQVVFGHPWAGVLLSIAAMCAGICWMLQAWTSPGWALLGGLLAGLRLGVFPYWTNTYWGGAVTALGGVLVLGALPRIQRAPRVKDALLMAFGVGLLATTRPFEALFVLLPVAAVLLWTLLRSDDGVPRSQKVWRFVAPMAASMMVLITFLAVYNWKVTGSPLKNPYALGRQGRNIAHPFVWQKPDPEPVYQHAMFRDFYVGWELPLWERIQEPAGYAREMYWRVKEYWKFFIRPVFTIPVLIMVPWLWWDRRLRVLLAIICLTAIGTLAATWGPPYYHAATTGLVFILITEGLRRLRDWQPSGKPAGLFLSRSIPVLSVVVFLTLTACAVLRADIYGEDVLYWTYTKSRLRNRALVLAQLEKLPGKHLAIVRYRSTADPHMDWVFNGADIDGSKVVWAREMGPEENQQLLQYFQDRRAWLVQPSNPDRTQWLTPYPGTSAQGTLSVLR
ncbi:MAG TPA: hypothetical protein VE621_09195 [Bryobacteraceae bacterium]|nr:hypothetical protein [Bryobacteraceae bacterium]